MAGLNLLRVEMTVMGGDVFPLVHARLVRNASIRTSMHALIDTGAAITLFPGVIAGELGITDEELDAGQRLAVSGVGGGALIARSTTVDLALSSRAQRMVLPAATVFFLSPWRCPFAALLGQNDALERLELFHRNQPPRPEFVLRLPV